MESRVGGWSVEDEGREDNEKRRPRFALTSETKALRRKLGHGPAPKNPNRRAKLPVRDNNGQTGARVGAKALQQRAKMGLSLEFCARSFDVAQEM